jgi:ABC-type multidrug transport system ATPase subunit
MPKHKEGIIKRVVIPTKQIIYDVEGIAKPGKLLAIMGASGAGKTTLLNFLTMRNNGNLKASGVVKLNGKVINSSDELASISGYVQQDDIFIGTIKVKEHLRFQAMLKLGKSYTTEEKNERVEEVLRDVI